MEEIEVYLVCEILISKLPPLVQKNCCEPPKTGKSSEDIAGKEKFHSCPLSCPCQIVDRYCVECIGGFAIQMIRTFPGSH